MAGSIVQAAIRQVLEKVPDNSPRGCLVNSMGKELLGKCTVGDTEQTVFDEFCQWLVTYLRERITFVTKGLKLSSSKRTRIWSEFHKIQIDSSGEMKLSWKKLLVALGVSNAEEVDPLLEKSVFREVFVELVTEYFCATTMNKAVQTTESTELSSDELNAMRYACGYVPRSLLKKYERLSSDTYSEYIQCLSDMSVEGEGGDLLDYTRKWFELVNRGGLFPLNDTTFSFFIAVEKSVRVLLPKHILGTNISKDTFKKAVLEEIARLDDVQFYWTLLAHNIDDLEKSEALLTDVVNLWVTIRGFSIAASWLEEI